MANPMSGGIATRIPCGMTMKRRVSRRAIPNASAASTSPCGSSDSSNSPSTQQPPSSTSTSNVPKNADSKVTSALSDNQSQESIRPPFRIDKLASEKTGGVNAPTLATAGQLSKHGTGTVFVQGQLPKGSAESKVEVFAIDGQHTRSLGTLNVQGNSFRGVLPGTLQSNTKLFAKLSSVDSFDGVSSAFERSGTRNGAQLQVTTQADIDLDGIDSSLESLATGGDGNRDGILDSNQANVVSLPDGRYGNSFTLSTNIGLFHDVEALAPETAKEKLQLPSGSFSFTLADVPIGGIAVVDMFLPVGDHSNQYLKWDSATETFLPFGFDGKTGAVFSTGKVSIYLQDGGRGDADGIANGRIIDPSGPGTAPFDVGSPMAVFRVWRFAWRKRHLQQFEKACGRELICF